MFPLLPGRSNASKPGRRLVPGVATVALLAVALVGSPATGTGADTTVDAGAGAHAAWVGTWASSPVRGTTSATCPAGDAAIANQTVRNVVFASVGGSSVRVRLTNAFGTAALTVGSASVAVA